MQKLATKYLIILSVFFSGTVLAQSPNLQLKQADSLYARRKYSESFTLYQQLFDKGHFSPQMLLKMSYIKEGSGEIPDALYYLNIYYVNYPGRNILKKMESLAESKNIEGYTYNDVNYFLYLYYLYKAQIIMGLVGILFIFFLSIFTNRVVFRRIPVTSPYLFLFMATFVFLFINYSDRFFYKGIVANENVLVMDSPSAGGNVITKLPKGTRMHIWGDTDIWYKIHWEGKSAYVRKINLKLALSADEQYKGGLFAL